MYAVSVSYIILAHFPYYLLHIFLYCYLYTVREACRTEMVQWHFLLIVFIASLARGRGCS